MSDDETGAADDLIWLQRTGEKNEHYAAFVKYLHMEEPRSLRKLSKTLDVALGSTRNWSGKWAWPARAAAHDAAMEKTKEAVRVQVMATEAAKWATRRLKDSEDFYGIAQRLRVLILRVLHWPTKRKEVMRKGTCECGRSYEKAVIYHPIKWSSATALKACQNYVNMCDIARKTAESDELDDFDPETATQEECRAVIARHKAKRVAIRDARIGTIDHQGAGL